MAPPRMVRPARAGGGGSSSTSAPGISSPIGQGGHVPTNAGTVNWLPDVVPAVVLGDGDLSFQAKRRPIHAGGPRSSGWSGDAISSTALCSYTSTSRCSHHQGHVRVGAKPDAIPASAWSNGSARSPPPGDVDVPPALFRNQPVHGGAAFSRPHLTFWRLPRRREAMFPRVVFPPWPRSRADAMPVSRRAGRHPPLRRWFSLPGPNPSVSNNAAQAALDLDRCPPPGQL